MDPVSLAFSAICATAPLTGSAVSANVDAPASHRITVIGARNNRRNDIVVGYFKPVQKPGIELVGTPQSDGQSKIRHVNSARYSLRLFSESAISAGQQHDFETDSGLNSYSRTHNQINTVSTSEHNVVKMPDWYNPGSQSWRKVGALFESASDHLLFSTSGVGIEVSINRPLPPGQQLAQWYRGEGGSQLHLSIPNQKESAICICTVGGRTSHPGVMNGCQVLSGKIWIAWLELEMLGHFSDRIRFNSRIRSPTSVSQKNPFIPSVSSRGKLQLQLRQPSNPAHLAISSLPLDPSLKILS